MIVLAVITGARWEWTFTLNIVKLTWCGHWSRVLAQVIIKVHLHLAEENAKAIFNSLILSLLNVVIELDSPRIHQETTPLPLQYKRNLTLHIVNVLTVDRRCSRRVNRCVARRMTSGRVRSSTTGRSGCHGLTTFWIRSRVATSKLCSESSRQPSQKPSR